MKGILIVSFAYTIAMMKYNRAMNVISKTILLLETITNLEGELTNRSLGSFRG